MKAATAALFLSLFANYYAAAANIAQIKRETCKNISIFVLLRQSSQFSESVVHFSEQIMSADKYPSTFSCQMGAIAYLSSPGFHYPRNLGRRQSSRK